MSSSPNPSMIHLLPTPSLEWGAPQNSYWLKNVAAEGGKKERGEGGIEEKRERGGRHWLLQGALTHKAWKRSRATLWSNGFLHAARKQSPPLPHFPLPPQALLGHPAPPYGVIYSPSRSRVVGLTPTALATTYDWPPARCQWNMSITWRAGQTAPPSWAASSTPHKGQVRDGPGFTAAQTDRSPHLQPPSPPVPPLHHFTVSRK